MKKFAVCLAIAISVSSGCKGVNLKQLGLASTAPVVSNPSGALLSHPASASDAVSLEAVPSEGIEPASLSSPTQTTPPSPSPSPIMSPPPSPIPSPIVIPFHEIGSPVATDDLPWRKFSAEANDGSGKKLEFHFGSGSIAGSWISTDSVKTNIGGVIRIPGYQWTLGISKETGKYFYWFPYRNPSDNIALFGRVNLYISNVGSYYGAVVDHGFLAFAVQPSGKWAASYISDAISFGTLDGITTSW